MRIGLLGCGMIRKQYIQACSQSRWLDIVACTDLITERAQEAAAAYAEAGEETPRVCSFEDMLSADDIDMVLNITNPKAHAPLSLRVLEAGKHVYIEKPLAVTREEGATMLDAARANNVRLGCAPDTFLGCGHQTSRALLDGGAIGDPTAVSLFFAGGGPDGYHEDPELFYQPGAGPMFDIGVYVLTDVVQLLGPVVRVSAMSKRTFEERTVLSEKKRGQTFKVEVPTHVTASLAFDSGVIGTMITSYDMKGAHSLPHIEVYGTTGSLSVPNPNAFNGVPRVFDAADRDAGWQDMPHTHGHATGPRGIGAADMAAAAANKREHRASGELAYHVLDIGLAIYESADKRREVDVASRVTKPSLMPEGVTEDVED